VRAAEPSTGCGAASCFRPGTARFRCPASAKAEEDAVIASFNFAITVEAVREFVKTHMSDSFDF
jgi:hypothetical protein